MNQRERVDETREREKALVGRRKGVGVKEFEVENGVRKWKKANRVCTVMDGFNVF